VGSPRLTRHASILGQNVTHVVGYNTMLERKRKRKSWDVKFDASDAHDGLVGCKCVTL
jgi:hypothetical protein